MSFLVFLFGIVALIYASVGFGGGSTYTALLVLIETNYTVLPIISLSCNLLVVAGGTFNFARAHAIPWSRAITVCSLSIPLAWLGGRISLPENLFIGLLATSLFLAGTLLLLDFNQKPSTAPIKKHAYNKTHNTKILEIIMGGGIGFLSGLVGIGGGIFLAPLLYLLHWSNARAIAGTASLFILVNSLAGIAGQVQKLSGDQISTAFSFWPFFIAVIIGGQIGNRLGVSILPERWMKRLTAALVIIVAIRLFIRLSTLLE